jgi:hypothetical protein
MRGSSAIVGVGESRYYRPAATETEFQLACIAIKNAADDAGLAKFTNKPRRFPGIAANDVLPTVRDDGPLHAL